MKLLKTVLLSTVLIGTTYGTSTTLPDGSNVRYSTEIRTDAEAFADSLCELRKEQAQYLTLIQQITTKVYIGEVAIGSTGEFVSYIHALSKGLNALIRERNELVAERDGLKEAVETSASAHIALAAEKEAADSELQGLRIELASVSQSLQAKTVEAATASARVELLTAELATAQKAAEEASDVSRKKVEQLSAALNAEMDRVKVLNTEVARLTNQNSALESRVVQAKAEQIAIAQAIKAEAIKRRLAALAIDLDE